MPPSKTIVFTIKATVEPDARLICNPLTIEISVDGVYTVEQLSRDLYDAIWAPTATTGTTWSPSPSTRRFAYDVVARAGTPNAKIGGFPGRIAAVVEGVPAKGKNKEKPSKPSASERKQIRALFAKKTPKKKRKVSR